MKKEIIINVTKEETKAAVLENGQLMEVYLERAFDVRLAGNIYKGRVENVLPGMQAAFVNIGLERNAFLHVDDVHKSPIHPDIEEKGKKLPIQNLLQEGQEILVQVVKEPLGTKGARVTTQITLPGRYTVLFPNMDCLGVSRRIHRERERERLKAIGEEIRIPGIGLIIRTAAEGIDKEGLRKDVLALYAMWQEILEKAAKTSAPALLHREVELVSWVLRDLFSEDVERIVINDPKTYKKALKILEVIGPHLKTRVVLHEADLWSEFGLEQEINRALRPKVWLKNGGYLVIEETEALTVIDVNTGKYTGSKNFAETAFHTNMEAVKEIARQLRLRNLGGIIIIDFIDMESPEHKNEVLKHLEKELEKDKTQTFVLGLTQLGLVELTRKKVRPSLSSILERPCPYCEGKGKILSEETVSLKACQEIKDLARKTQAPALLVEAHPSVAALLIGSGGSRLRELEQDTGKQIIVKGMENLHMEEVHVRSLHDQKEIATLSAPVKVGEILEVKVEDAHASNPEDGIARVHGYVIDVENGRAFVGETIPVEITKVYRTYARARVLKENE
ncbi:MAG: Ribonuclease G [Thermoanaerobacterales bacterium 50_218]|nr:MAG: Ribonuclease G [Thermoanaerobacterales bacterium 50_218]HAA90775.1 ribonuclease G [Peptococcaceae bacterium]